MVRSEFGTDLRHMTPANVREFLDRVHDRVDGPAGLGGRFYLNEPERTYEGIVRDFLQQSLEMPADQAVIRLWLYCLEMVSASVIDLETEKFERLFAPIGTSDGVE